MTLTACVAKLARLMEQGPPQFVDPNRLAEQKGEISGTLDIAGMPRLADLLSQERGSVSYTLRFDRDEHRRSHISGDFNADLHMQCQRCLLPVKVRVNGVISVTLVADEDEAIKLPGDVEPLVIEGKKLSLLTFFEDELLLALPLAPNHDTEECHAQGTRNETKHEERQRPFAVLKDFKFKNSKD